MRMWKRRWHGRRTRSDQPQRWGCLLVPKPQLLLLLLLPVCKDAEGRTSKDWAPSLIACACTDVRTQAPTMHHRCSRRTRMPWLRTLLCLTMMACEWGAGERAWCCCASIGRLCWHEIGGKGRRGAGWSPSVLCFSCRDALGGAACILQPDRPHTYKNTCSCLLVCCTTPLACETGPLLCCRLLVHCWISPQGTVEHKSLCMLCCSHKRLLHPARPPLPAGTTPCRRRACCPSSRRRLSARAGTSRS